MSEQWKQLQDQMRDIDRKLVELLGQRQKLAEQASQLPTPRSETTYDRGPNEAAIAELAEYGYQWKLDAMFVGRVFRDIFDYSLRRQRGHVLESKRKSAGPSVRVRVGFQGGEGAYSYLAAVRHFGGREHVDVSYEGYDNFEHLLEAVRKGHIDFGLLPIENTTAGSINESYDLLAQMDLALVGEEIQRVEHCLVGFEHVQVNEVRRVLSHPQALAQCSEFLGSLRDCHVEAFADTALAVGKVRRDQDRSQAAIASAEAARIYDLNVLQRNIANQKHNYTRMVIVAREPVAYDNTVSCKTSLIFATRHEKGALVRCLNVLADYGLNLSKLESRPRAHKPWEYTFYIDIEGNIEEERVRQALGHLGTRGSYLKVLGSYPPAPSTL